MAGRGRSTDGEYGQRQRRSTDGEDRQRQRRKTDGEDGKQVEAEPKWFSLEVVEEWSAAMMAAGSV